MADAKTPRRLTLVVTSLEAGGAERVLSALANSWAEEGRQVTVITLHHGRADFYALNPGVTRVALDVLRPSTGVIQAVLSNLTRLVTLRRAIRASRPDVVLAFTDQTNVLTLLATRGLGVPVVVSERTNPAAGTIGKPWERVRRFTYPWASRVVVQTEAARRWCAGFLSDRRLTVIPNAVADVAQGNVPASLPPYVGTRRLVAGMGSLVPNKGFADLLQAFGGLAGDFGEWDLLIMGEGPERARLESDASAMNITGRVHLPGLVKQPGRVLEHVAIFVLSSRVEGFPNALLEAMASGCACVSFDCPNGPSDIITEGVNGFLVRPGDVAGLREAVRRLMEQPSLRASLGERAREVRHRFAPATVLQQWNTVLKEVC